MTEHRPLSRAARRLALPSLLACAQAYAAAPPQDVSGDCDSPAFQVVLSPAAARFDAQAVWLDRRLIRWPGMAADGVYKLYRAPDGGIAAPVGGRVAGAAGAVALAPSTAPLPAATAARFRHVGGGVLLRVAGGNAALRGLHRQQLVLVREDARGIVRAATRVQAAGALDDLYAAAADLSLGADPARGRTRFAVWAPTARRATVCVYDGPATPARTALPMRFDARTGAWHADAASDLSGSYYKYAVDVPVDGAGIVRNLVTDPYSVSLSADGKRSWVARLDASNLKPEGWDALPAPATVRHQADMTVYELHVRDFSIGDATVAPERRGKYTAFLDANSNGMRHLAALAGSGLTDVHLLPVFDFGSVPETGCVTPATGGGAPDGTRQQAAVVKDAAADCYNWGYDPVHFNAPEGSYASDPQDAARRVREFREMVAALHRTGLRVGMDVVFNHAYIAGQNEKSVLDRVVPGYYHRLDARGAIERSTCCDNTATEHLMMGKLMIDSAVLWASAYRIDSFRFDLMGHQPRAAMERLRAQVQAKTGRTVHLIGEGWNFGEVKDGARFVQASQLSLNGSGIGTFNDRLRDAVRGGAAGDGGAALFARQGWSNGLGYDPNGHTAVHTAAHDPAAAAADLRKAADLVRAGLAGSIRDYELQTADGRIRRLDEIDYNGQPAGYASAPGEVVNYVENHDNQTLFDNNVFKLPPATSGADRARVQVLGMAATAFAQGVAYFHAGIDVLRSKSLDRNSFESGDWFNRLDWTYRDNGFGAGLPPAPDNGKDWDLMRPLLADASIKPSPADIAFARDAFRDLLAIRAGSTLFRLPTGAEVRRRLRFFNTGAAQVPTVVAAHLDGRGWPGAGFAGIRYFINVDKVARTVADQQAVGRKLRLHPVQAAPGAADKRAAQAAFDAAGGSFTIPPRTAVVFVED